MADVFTDEEFEEHFGEPARPDGDGSRRIPAWAKALGAIVAIAMLAGTALNLIDGVLNRAQINEPAEIRTAALERVAESEWGWLVTDVLVQPIEAAQVGAFVTNNPPDGIIIVDLRPWNLDRLDRLVDHEIGHLLDFAVWGPVAADQRRAGLGSEAWAECAAVAAGTRDLDRDDTGDAYHCYSDELEVFGSAVAGLNEVCRRWDDEECRRTQSPPG